MECSTERIVLTCPECEEQVVVFGPLADWRSRGAVLLCESAHQIILDEYDAAREEALAAS